MKRLYPRNSDLVASILLHAMMIAVQSCAKAFVPSMGAFLPSPSSLPINPIFTHSHPGPARRLSIRALELSGFAVTLLVPSAHELEEVGALLAAVSSAPDVVFLNGDLGAGKTTLARGFVLCRLGVDGVDHETWVPRVTSPTYLLSNTYRFRDVDSGRDCEIHHVDLYRLRATAPQDFEPLQLRRVFDECISLIEWPVRLQGFPDLLPPSEHRLDVTIDNMPQTTARRVQLVAGSESTWTERLDTLIGQGLLDDLLLADDTSY